MRSRAGQVLLGLPGLFTEPQPQFCAKLLLCSILPIALSLTSCGSASVHAGSSAATSGHRSTSTIPPSTPTQTSVPTTRGVGSSPASLIATLRSCSIPTVPQVQAALGAAGKQVGQISVVYQPPPGPPYDAAPNYAVPKNSCDYGSPGNDDAFAISWFTDPTYIANQFDPGGPAGYQFISTPPSALRAYTLAGTVQVLYRGIWMQWDSYPSLNQEIEASVAACLTSSC